MTADEKAVSNLINVTQFLCDLEDSLNDSDTIEEAVSNAVHGCDRKHLKLFTELLLKELGVLTNEQI